MGEKSPQEVRAKMNCDRCGKVYNEFIGDRFWSGEFTDDDGETFRTLCDDCHRAVAR